MTTTAWRWTDKPFHPEWRIAVREPGEPTPLLVEVLFCQQAWRWLTRAQRSALLAHTVGDRISAHPRVLAGLRKHAIIDDACILTDAGRLLRKWNVPTVPDGDQP